MGRASSPGALLLPGLEDYGLSPIRRQYLELKRQRPDALLFFRLGDFYETFEQDAETAARVLDLALTSREMGRGERLPMAGIPAQAVEGYLARLLAAGHHVAIADQVGEVPRTGLVRREIVRVLTPGTLLEDDLLVGARNNFLAAVVPQQTGWGLAYVDVSTGELAATELQASASRSRGDEAAELLAAELVRLGPAECLVPEDARETLQAWLPPGAYVTTRGAELFAARAALRTLTRQVGGAPEATGLVETPLALRAVGALLAYVQEARPGAAATLQSPRLYAAGGTMVLDRATRRHLDLLDSSSASGTSLLAVLDRTHSPMGGRLLRAWLGQPLLDPAAIKQRLDAVERLVHDAALRARMATGLKGLPDLERLAVRAGQRLLAPRECLALAAGLERLPVLQAALGGDLPDLLARGAADLDPVPEAVREVRATLREDATVFEEGVIKPGVSAELDQQRTLGGDARRWIADLEQRERERTGVRAAKVGYNRVFGYYFEVSTAACGQPTDYYQRQGSGATTVGEHLERLGWSRKQTLAHAERFVTPDLKDLEGRIARASEEALRLERALYNALLERLATFAPRIAQSARASALLDVIAALAETAVARGYSRPVVDDGDALAIVGGRHPVVETTLPPGAFVPNDAHLDQHARVLLLTGPNMAGKSTYLRQVALIVLLAQVGSFVPAEQAHIGVVDRVFTRIGAHDDLAAGRSTFLVEMNEAAAILRGATARGLVLLDEIGRGTSTFDGLALAQAIVEDLHDDTRPRGAPKVIVATHYHELTALEERLPRVRNARLDVLERGDEIVFLHSVVPGGADRSYGVHVARLAGIPERVTHRAWSLLRDLETRRDPAGEVNHAPPAACAGVCLELATLDVLALSPLEAQAALYRLQQRAASPDGA